ncbi:MULTISPECIES: LppU/SCO3897 family protein [Actinopolyspora]|uniref:Uncharacterized protein n=1 Tax=Actinopolyspora saharensis TaxID=995062 RepID=A0A1H1EWY8_9ACTN|nr:MULTISPECIES: hypothetical protein [Actinopolyspora]NHD18258.1 hypothetical protein [Actinopolyspora sp. BKK2]NHE77063.1 hypothetical protein [Actinopolyspora sp. BKK1]SDQ93049.1 hypothetical protein SAMN04489718_2720 [Actinopolyspora saharensis]
MNTPPDTPDSEDPSTWDVEPPEGSTEETSEESAEAEPRAERQVDEEDEEPDPHPAGGKRRKLLGSLVALAVVVLLGCGALFGWNAWKSGSAGAVEEMLSDIGGVDLAEGDCVHLPRGGKNVDFEKAGCGSARSDFRVVELREDSQRCAKESYGALLVNEDVYCMIPDVEVGDCVADLKGETTLLTKVNCADEAAGWRVTGVADVADSEECAAGAMYQTYPEPARTLCFAELSRD